MPAEDVLQTSNHYTLAWRIAMPTLPELVLGLQHIGIPTRSIEKTIDFYRSLGFIVIHAPEHEHKKVAFLKLADVVIEAYENDETAGRIGAIDHIALNVRDIQAAYVQVRSLGYQELENGIQTLPFFSKGVSYFTIQGPNAEKVEFSQYL